VIFSILFVVDDSIVVDVDDFELQYSYVG